MHINLVQCDETKKTEKVVETYTSWNEAHDGAAKYIAAQNSQSKGAWKHVFHTVWWHIDGGSSIGLRPVILVDETP